MGYGLLCAILWGTADFFARLAAERVGTRRAIFWMQLCALAGTSVVLALPSTWPSWPSDRMLALAAAIGLFNVAGATMLYRALEIGTVSLVSPVSSTFAAITALLAVGTGERPGALAGLGLLVTAVGMFGASLPPTSTSSSPTVAAPRTGLGLAAGSALLWGISFFGLRYVVKDLGVVFPLWMSRLVSVIALGTVAMAQRRPIERPTGAWRWVLGIAVFDSAAFAAYNAGLTQALTSVVSVLASLYSAVTVLLAYLFLGERLAPRQWASVLLILVGIGLASSPG